MLRMDLFEEALVSGGAVQSRAHWTERRRGVTTPPVSDAGPAPPPLSTPNVHQRRPLLVWVIRATGARQLRPFLSISSPFGYFWSCFTAVSLVSMQMNSEPKTEAEEMRSGVLQLCPSPTQASEIGWRSDRDTMMFLELELLLSRSWLVTEWSLRPD